MNRIKKNISDKKYYGWFDKKADLDNVQLYKLIKEFIYKKFKKPVIFDMGCGQGMVCNYLKGVGFDNNRYAINLAKKNYKNNKFYKVDALNINIKNLGLKHADVVVCLNMIEHLKDSDRNLFMKNVLPSVTKKNGYIIFSLYRQYFLPNILNMLLRRKSFFDPTHVHNWSAISFRNEISKYFKVVSCQNVSGYTALTWITKYLKTETLIIAKLIK